MPGRIAHRSTARSGDPHLETLDQGILRRGGGGGVWAQKFVYQKWPDQIFPMVSFVFFPRSSLWSGGYPPPCDIPWGCCSFTGPWMVTRSSLRMLRRVAAFCRPLRPVLLQVSFPGSRSPVVGVLGLCWMWQDVPFARQRRPIIGVLRMRWLLPVLQWFTAILLLPCPRPRHAAAHFTASPGSESYEALVPLDPPSRCGRGGRARVAAAGHRQT